MNRPGLVDNSALQRAILVGTLLQIAFVLIAHFSAWIETHVLFFAGMMASATIGYLYAQEVAKGYARGAYGGAIAGGLCALSGIALSVVLGDMTGSTLLDARPDFDINRCRRRHLRPNGRGLAIGFSEGGRRLARFGKPERVGGPGSADLLLRPSRHLI